MAEDEGEEDEVEAEEEVAAVVVAGATIAEIMKEVDLHRAGPPPS